MTINDCIDCKHQCPEYTRSMLGTEQAYYELSVKQEKCEVKDNNGKRRKIFNGYNKYT